jgi:iron(III) transport system permease protein
MTRSGVAMARRIWRSRAVRFAPLLAVLGLLLVWPLAMLVTGSFRTQPPGFPTSWTLRGWSGAFGEPGVVPAIRNSLTIAVVTTTLATLTASGLAFLSERTDAPLRRWITPGLLLLFAMPGLLYAMGYALLANAYTGLLNLPVQVLTGQHRGPLDIETWPGLLVVMSLKKVSVIYLFLIGPFRALDSAHEEASLICGANAWTTFLRIDLPLLAPALTGAALLGIVSGLQAFDMVLVLGWPFNLQVLTTRIFELVNLSATPEYGRASALSLGLLAVVAALSLVQMRILGRRSFVAIGGKARMLRRLPLRALRPLFGGLTALFLLAAVALPVAAVAFTSFQRFPGIYSGLSLANYDEILQIPRLSQALLITLGLGLGAGLAAMMLALAVAQAGRSGGPRFAGALRLVMLAPLAMPGVVTGLAVAWAFLSLPGFKLLYGTAWLVDIALLVSVTPFATQAASAAVAQISPDLIEAARMSGASARRATGDILLRLIAPSFLAGWFVTAVLVAGNLEVPLLLEAPGQEPVSAVVYDLFNRGEFSDACALLMVMLLAEGAVGLAGYAALRAAGSLLAAKPRLSRSVPAFTPLSPEPIR